MCELFGVSGKDELTVNEYLKTLASHSNEHPSGWGLAIFKGNSVNIEKEPVTAYKSRYLKERLAVPIRAKNMLAHIRFATRGAIGYNNCHPFTGCDSCGRTWTLIHNGTIFECPLLDEYVYLQEGNTDSERVLLYIIDQIDLVTEAFGRPLSDVERFNVVNDVVSELSIYNKLNLMIYDGELLYIHKNYKNSMFMKRNGHSVMFSTVPLDLGTWDPVPMCQLLAYKDGQKLFSGPMHENEYSDSPEDMHYIFLDYSEL